jgi:hypothetical protein
MIERIESKIDKSGDCWLWTACTSEGYGRIWLNGRLAMAHRVVYEYYKGPITEATLDHLCRNRLCVKPSHLEPVSHRINLLRGVGVTARNSKKTHCKNGHELSGDNLLISRGKRVCRICNKKWTGIWRAKIKKQCRQTLA